MGNLSELVLMAAIGCMMAGKNVGTLEFPGKNREEQLDDLSEEDREGIENKLNISLSVLFDKVGISPLSGYFT